MMVICSECEVRRAKFVRIAECEVRSNYGVQRAFDLRRATAVQLTKCGFQLRTCGAHAALRPSYALRTSHARRTPHIGLRTSVYFIFDSISPSRLISSPYFAQSPAF